MKAPRGAAMLGPLLALLPVAVAAGAEARAAVAAGGATGGGVTPVAKVLEMLSGLAAKGEQEKHKEEVAFSAYAEFCRLTSADKQRAIKSQADTISELETAISKADADADRLSEQIAGLDSDLAGWDAEKKKATTVRDKEQAEYMATHQDYSESIDAIERAVLALKSSSADVPQATASLLKLGQARIPAAARQALDSFLQAGAAGAAEAAAPEANAYEFQSSSVVEMLEKLRQRFMQERKSLEEEELNRKHAYEMMMQSLADDTAYAEGAHADKVAAKAVRMQDSAAAKGDLASTQSSKAEDEAYLRDLTVNCGIKSKEFKDRQALRAGELDAIRKAVEIISSPEVSGAAAQHLPSAAALLDVRRAARPVLAQLRSSGGARGVRPAQARASSLLMQRAGRAGSTFLASIAGRVAADPFVKVKKMIKDLLVRLMEEANEEADHKGWCDEELATNKKSRSDLSAEVESLTAQVDELSALDVKLGQDITELGDAIAGIEAAVAKATADRKEERETNAATLADAKAAQAAVMQAITLLKDYYAQAEKAVALMQQRQSPPATWDTAYTGMQGGSTGVLGLLDVIQSDFARLEAKTTTSEDEAQREHESFLADSEQDKTVKDREMRHKGYKRESTKRKLNEAKKELAATQEELSTTLDYYEKLKPDCVNTGLSYEERVARRREEIASLQEALKILEGEDLSGAPL